MPKFKNELNQPSISTFINSPKSPRTPRTRQSRSLLLKRKSPPSGKKPIGKRQILGKMASSETDEQPIIGKNTEKVEKVYSPELTEFKKDMMDSFKELLNPINDSIKQILQVQKELKDELVVTKDVKAENERLKQRVVIVEKNNNKLTQCIICLENKLLET